MNLNYLLSSSLKPASDQRVPPRVPFKLTYSMILKFQEVSKVT